MTNSCQPAEISAAREAIGAEQFDSLTVPEQNTVCRAMSLVSDKQYQTAWQTLLRDAPDVGKPYLARLLSANPFQFDEFTLAGLRTGKCQPQRLAEIVKSLSFGGNIRRDVLEAVVDNMDRWPDSHEFRENFMRAVQTSGHRSAKIARGVEEIYCSLEPIKIPSDNSVPDELWASADALVWMFDGIPDDKKISWLTQRAEEIPDFALPLVEAANLHLKDNENIDRDSLQTLRVHFKTNDTDGRQAIIARRYVGMVEMRQALRVPIE